MTQKILNRAKLPPKKDAEVGAWRATAQLFANLLSDVEALRKDNADLRAKLEALEATKEIL